MELFLERGASCSLLYRYLLKIKKGKVFKKKQVRNRSDLCCGGMGILDECYLDGLQVLG